MDHNRPVQEPTHPHAQTAKERTEPGRLDETQEIGHRGHWPGRRHGKHHKDMLVRHRDYSTLDLDSKLIWNFREIGHTLLHSFEGKGSQQRILIMLAQTGPMTQSLLTTRLGIQPGSASEVLSKLERVGFILRTPSKSDQRTADVTLTEAGKAAAAQAEINRRQRQDKLFSVLSDEEKDLLLSMLERLNQEWETGSDQQANL